MAGYITLGIVVLGLFIEITPVKVNPISWLGKHFNKDMDDKIKDMQKTYQQNHKEIVDKLDSTNERIDMNDIADIRTRIASIATIIKQGGTITEDQFNCVFKDIDKWNEYHKKYPNLNGIVNVSIEIITEEYKKIR